MIPGNSSYWVIQVFVKVKRVWKPWPSVGQHFGSYAVAERYAGYYRRGLFLQSDSLQAWIHRNSPERRRTRDRN
jgi:hypothetical protein